MSVIQLTIRVAWSVAVAVVAGAILVILHVFDVYPERRLAFAVLGMIADQRLLEALQWTAVAAVAVVSAGLYNVVAWRLSKRKLVSVDDERKPITDQSQSLTPNFAIERRQIAETEIATLTADEQSALRQMLIAGRPKNLSDQIWQSLEMKTSFVERDFTGPKGIKIEFRSVLEKILVRNRKPIISAVSPIGDSRDSEALADFLFSADELIKRIVSSNDDLNKWKQDYQEWNTKVTNYIRNNISHTQAYHFSNPGMVVVRQFDGVYNDEHNSLLNSLAVRRENLRHIHSLES